MDVAIGIIDDRVIEHEHNKLSKTDASSDIVNVEYDEDTSVFKFTKRNGDYVSVDVSSVVVREGYTKEESDNRYANAIKRTYSGETIVATDSSGVHLEGLRVLGRSEQASTTGKNLLKNTAMSQTINGVTFTVNDDGSVSIDGTSSNIAYFDINTDFDSNALEGCILSYGKDVSGCSIRISSQDSRESVQDIFVQDEIVANGNGLRLSIRVNGGITVSDKTFYPMIRLASIEDDTYEPYTGGQPSPSPEYPQPIESVGDDGSIDVGVYGGQLFDERTYPFTNGYYVNYTNGNFSNNDLCKAVLSSIPFKQYAGKTLYINKVPNGGIEGMAFYDINHAYISGAKSNVFTVPENTVYMRFCVNIDDEDVVINIGDTVLPWEPYKAKQSLITSTPNGLPAIKVTDASLATYTDADGNMWCADEVDFARGKYVQRVQKLDLDSLTWEYKEEYNFWASNQGLTNAINGMPLLCETIPYNKCSTSDTEIGTKVNEQYNIWARNGSIEIAPTGKAYYALAKPIETDLTASEIEAYKALTSNYPTTTILNDENAHMEAVLVTDTKNHIEQNYVPKSEFLSVVDRVSALEQKALA